MNLLNSILSAVQHGEYPCLEYKKDNANPEEIGEYISALSNSAALEERKSAFMIWGIDNETRLPIGTKFRPADAKKGNQTLHAFLTFGLLPRLDFTFHEFEYETNHLVILEIPVARHQPTA